MYCQSDSHTYFIFEIIGKKCGTKSIAFLILEMCRMHNILLSFYIYFAVLSLSKLIIFYYFCSMKDNKCPHDQEKKHIVDDFKGINKRLA